MFVTSASRRGMGAEAMGRDVRPGAAWSISQWPTQANPPARSNPSRNPPAPENRSINLIAGTSLLFDFFVGPRSKGGASPLSLKIKKPQAAGKIQCLGRMGELMRLYRQKWATLGQQGRFRAFVGSLSHRRKKGACWGRHGAESLLRGGFYWLRKKRLWIYN